MARVALYLQDAHPIRDGMRYAQIAEAAGFEAVWQAESRLVREATIPLAAFGAATERIKLGSGVVSMWVRNPAFLAATFSTLDDLAPGRVVLGIGAWWDPLVAKVGVSRDRPLRAMREIVTVVRELLLAGETVTFDGDFVHLDGVELDYVHQERRPKDVPIVIGATGMQMMQLAGEIADGALLNYLVSPAYNASALEALAAGAAKAGRAVDDIDRPQLVVRSMDDDRDAALDAARLLVTQYLGQQPHIMKASGVPADLLDAIGEVLTWPATHEQVLAASKLVPDDVVQLITASGTPDECRAKVSEYVKAGCTCPVLYPLGADVEQMIDAFREWEEPTNLNYDEYLRRLPKVELHCHVEGTLRPQTVAELARGHDIELPTTDVDRIYDYETIYEFLQIFRLVNSTVITQGDFARIAYESLEDGVKLGNLKYREMFFNPTLHTTRGVAMATIIDGLADGCAQAELDFGVRCRLIADVYRQDPPAMALQMTEEVIANRRDELIGLGMDAAEAPDPPEKFVESFALVGRSGLRRTSHASEDGPPVNITTCLDVLGCERIDHGYHILEDDAVVARCRDEGIHFTCCPTSTAVVYGWPDLTTHPINGMMRAGLLVHLNSDDPTMFHTDIGKEYSDFVGQNDYAPEIAKQLVHNGVDATWLDAGEQTALHRLFDDEIAALDKELVR